MAKTQIIRPKNFDRFLAELEDRADSLRTLVVERVAKDFRAQVQAAAPKGGSEAYARHVSLRKVTGRDARLAVLVDEQSMDVAKLPTETVYTYQALSRKYEALPLLAALRKYEPFPQDLLPVAAQSKQFRLVFRRVTAKEAQQIRDRISSAWREIQTALLRAKVSRELLLAPGVPPETKAVENLAFRTIRQEFGINANRQPVWLPAVQAFRSGVSLKEVLAEKRTRRLMSDPSYGRWDKVSTVVEETDEATIKQLDEFQSRILK